MPRCLADRYGAASGAWGFGGSWSHSMRFSDVGTGAGRAGMEQTWQRARQARLSLVGIGRNVGIGIHLEHGRPLDGVSLEPRGYARRSDRWKTDAVARLPEGAVEKR